MEKIKRYIRFTLSLSIAIFIGIDISPIIGEIILLVILIIEFKEYLY